MEVFGIQPGARHPGPITDFRCAAQVIANTLTAQERGYDAFVIGNFQDAGLAEARSAARIPVIGLGEATMLHACTLGPGSAWSRSPGCTSPTTRIRSPATGWTGG